MGRNPPVIPVSKLLEGCQLCLSNAMQFAEEADLLLQKDFLPHAFALVILGFQELGKFGELLENFVNAIHTNAKKVEVKAFFNHSLKMRARMKHYLASERALRRNSKTQELMNPTTKEERRWKSVFESAPFVKSVKMLGRNGENERLAATYVDFSEGTMRWIPPRSPRKEVIEAHRRLLAGEAFSLQFTLRIKPPWVTLMAWKKG